MNTRTLLTIGAAALFATAAPLTLDGPSSVLTMNAAVADGDGGGDGGGSGWREKRDERKLKRMGQEQEQRRQQQWQNRNQGGWQGGWNQNQNSWNQNPGYGSNARGDDDSEADD